MKLCIWLAFLILPVFKRQISIGDIYLCRITIFNLLATHPAIFSHLLPRASAPHFIFKKPRGETFFSNVLGPRPTFHLQTYRCDLRQFDPIFVNLDTNWCNDSFILISLGVLFFYGERKFKPHWLIELCFLSNYGISHSKDYW